MKKAFDVNYYEYDEGYPCHKGTFLTCANKLDAYRVMRMLAQSDGVNPGEWDNSKMYISDNSGRVLYSVDEELYNENDWYREHMVPEDVK